jgi:hypothetical protein
VKPAEIVERLVTKLALPGGRHLYGVLGTCAQLDRFQGELAKARTTDGRPFPTPLNVNRGILDAIPDEDFLKLTRDEAKRPEPTAAHVARAFAVFLRQYLQGKGLVVLAHLELLFAYGIELNLLRTLAADGDRVLLLLPGRRDGLRVVMFPELTEGSYTLPTNLIADNHLWELNELYQARK